MAVRGLGNDLGSVPWPSLAVLSALCELISGQMPCGDWRFLPQRRGEASRYPDVDVFRLYYEEMQAKISA